MKQISNFKFSFSSNLPGVGKLPYIINDYHSKSTNPGYSRNNKGNFFTR